MGWFSFLTQDFANPISDTSMARKMVIISVKLVIRQNQHGHGPYLGHNQFTSENRQWENLHI